jgi:hypothetical protein
VILKEFEGFRDSSGAKKGRNSCSEKIVNIEYFIASEKTKEILLI